MMNDTAAAGWTSVRVQILRIAVLGALSMLAWVPFLFWLGQSDRPLLGTAGDLFVFGSVAIQAISLSVGLVLVAVMSEWDDVACRRASLVWNWIAVAVGLPFALVAGFQVAGYSRIGGGATLAAVLAGMLIVALASVRWPEASIVAGVLQSAIVIVIVITAILVDVGPSVLLAPATSYTVALAVAGAAAGYRRSLLRRHSERASNERPPSERSAGARTNSPR
jgi:hypothetical protein